MYKVANKRAWKQHNDMEQIVGINSLTDMLIAIRRRRAYEDKAIYTPIDISIIIRFASQYIRVLFLPDQQMKIVLSPNPYRQSFHLFEILQVIRNKVLSFQIKSRLSYIKLLIPPP